MRLYPQIWTMNLDGSERKQLALETTSNVFPSFSWDEKYMIMQNYNYMIPGMPAVEIPVYDADTLEMKATYTGRSAYWCEQHLTFVAEDEAGAVGGLRAPKGYQAAEDAGGFGERIGTLQSAFIAK